MPNVAGKDFPYTAQGVAAAEEQRNLLNRGAMGGPTNMLVGGKRTTPQASTPYSGIGVGNPLLGQADPANRTGPMFGGMGLGGPGMGGRGPAGGYGQQRSGYGYPVPMNPNHPNHPGYVPNPDPEPHRTPGLSDEGYGVPYPHPSSKPGPFDDQIGPFLGGFVERYPETMFALWNLVDPGGASGFSDQAGNQALNYLDQHTGGRTGFWLDKVKGLQSSSGEPGLGG